MSQGYPTADLYCEHHMETVERKVEKCEMIVAEILDYMQNPSHLISSVKEMKSNENLNEAGDFFQEFSREISIFALQYYLHEVVTPGVPNFQTLTQRVHFWACVCTNKLVATKAYLYNEEYNVDPIFLDDLWKLVRKTINSLKKLLSYPPN